jgi:hypothetical protein
MSRIRLKNTIDSRFAALSSFAATLVMMVLGVGTPANAQQTPETQGQSSSVAISRNSEKSRASTKSAQAIPPSTAFMGVQLGMSADEVRSKLQHIKDKGVKQDFFVFSDLKSAQVFYDDQGKVIALSVDYIGTESEVPLPEKVLGEAVQAKPDGSMHALKRFPEAGYWIAYSRTAGKNPITTVTIQKM